MQTSRIAYVFLLAFVSTVLALQWWQRASYPWEIGAILSIVACLSVIAMTQPQWRPVSILTLSCIAGITVAVLSVAHATHVPTPSTIDTYAIGKTVTVEGTITDEPDYRPLQSKYVINVSRMKAGTGAWTAVTGRVLASDPSGWPLYEHGDPVTVTGKLDRPGVIDDFHYGHYLSRYDIYSYMSRARVTRIAEGSGPLRLLYKGKNRFEARINTLFREPHASLLAGLLTGSRRGIPDNLQTAFTASGLTHIIAISGYNITLLLTILSTLLFWLPLKARFFPSVILIAVFSLFVGASASVVRAAIMGIIGLVALQAGRTTTSRLTVLWTLFFMLLWNPKQLWYDAGFQLSFLALLGLLELSPILKRYLTFLPEKFGLQESLTLTLSSQIATAPWIVFLFHRLSIVAPLANLLAPPVIPLAMLLGGLSVALSALWSPLGMITGILADGVLSWIILVATVCSHLPFASVDITSMGPVLVIVAYAGMGGTVLCLQRRAMVRQSSP